MTPDDFRALEAFVRAGGITSSEALRGLGSAVESFAGPPTIPVWRTPGGLAELDFGDRGDLPAPEHVGGYRDAAPRPPEPDGWGPRGCPECAGGYCTSCEPEGEPSWLVSVWRAAVDLLTL